MPVNRRNFLRGIGASSALLALPISTAVAADHPMKEEEAPVVQIGDNIAVVNTDKGKVKGFIMRGIYTFLGIPYAADTSGTNRFKPAVPHAAWEGVRPVVAYGNSAPQTVYSRASTSYGMFIDHWNYDEISEECLTINIWTPATDNRKRPVLVWLHGGGFRGGNGIEQDGYHGENFSRYGDVVFCSLNHRLGSFGFSDFSGVAGDEFKDSGNVGILDIVAALRWIHNNIANFGGDAGNVTIMGQSGGGAKVCTLATMPAIKGLAHKGVALSGSSAAGIPQSYSRKLGSYILREAGLTVADMPELQKMPWAEYLALADRAAARLQKESAQPGLRRGSFGPVADGVHLPENTFFGDAGQPAIPMLFCTTFHEQSPSRTDAALEQIDRAGVIDKVKGSYGDRATAIVDAYAKAFPSAKPIELLALILSSRKAVTETAASKLKQPAPVYMAWFGWCPPLFDGRMRAFHCLDISFWLLNTDLMTTHSGGGGRPRKLAAKMSDSLLQFMRTGNPNTKLLPAWPEYKGEGSAVMILNDVCEVKNDPDKEARKLL